MRRSFGQFELDDASRTLACAGEAVPLQPLVFDLLVHLVNARDRVVPKDELLDAVWAGVVVTEGSLQRAMSLLRGVLREGGLPDAVETHARRGYRFCEPVSEVTAASAGSARLASAGSAAQLEARGEEALCRGVLAEALAPFEQALALYEAEGARECAARVALYLANLKLELNELAIAKGWHTRALSSLSELPECRPHAMAAWLSARIALFEGVLDACMAHALRAAEIAQRVGDADVQTLSLVYRGHVLIATGEVRQGLALHDEAGVAAIAGRVGVYAGGIVFCSVILAYLNLGDTHRASQWSDEFTRWCQRFPAYAFPALCRLHRGEVLAQRGELANAEHEVSLARDQLAQSGPYTQGDAWRVLGDIRLARGELDDAEHAFRQAHTLGWNPQPGLALVFAARGQLDAALKQLERTIAAPGWADGQRARRLLSAVACVAARAGRLERSRSALEALGGLDEAGITHAGNAERERACAELAWAEGDVARAEALLRSSVRAWLLGGARVQAAHVRLRLTEALLALDDPSAAELELAAAEAAFREIQAAPMLTACEALRARVR